MKFALTLALLLSTPCVAQPPIIPADVHAEERESPFRRPWFTQFVFRKLRLPPPTASLNELGYETSQIQGQLLSNSGDPMPGVGVIIMPGPGGVTYSSSPEIYALTDEAGKFHLEADRSQTCVVFHDAEGVTWSAAAEKNAEVQQFEKPQTAKLNWIAPPQVGKSIETIAIRPKRELAARLAPVTYVEKNSDGAFVAELMPGEYIVTFTHPEQLEKIGVIENRGPLAVEIATLTAEPGKVAVPKLPDPVAVIGGLSEMPSEKQYITVQRSVAAPFYLDLSSSVVVDVVRPAKGGFFLTKRLPVGRYIVKLQATDRQPIVPIAAWCVQIESDSKSINLSRLPAPDTLREKIETLLVARGTYSGIHHQIFDLPPNLEAVIHTLRSMAADQNSPWQRKALQLLCEDCEDSIVLAEQLLKLLPDVPLSYQSEIVNRLADFSVEVAPLVELLASLTATKNVLVRSHVFTAMTRLALGNPDQADRITKIFETAIKSSDRQSRIAAALCLGRLREKASLPVLNELREEDIEAAFLVWQLDGDSAAFFEIANRFLERKGLFWQRRACVFIAKVTQQEPVPASTHRLLNTLSDRPIDIHPSPYYNVCLQEIAQQAQKILAKSNPSDP